MTTSDPREALDRIKARAAEATPGPWGHYTPRGQERDPIFGATPGDEVALVKRAPDWRFISHARTDIDRLTEALEAVLALHVERWTPNPIPGGHICDACREPVESEPCATVRAITNALTEEDK